MLRLRRLNLKDLMGMMFAVAVAGGFAGMRLHRIPFRTSCRWRQSTGQKSLAINSAAFASKFAKKMLAAPRGLANNRLNLATTTARPAARGRIPVGL